jgi:hypothetical protein
MGTGKTYSTKYLLDSNNSSGVAGQVLSTTSTGIDWVDANTVPGTGLWLANGNDIYNSNSGNVGIGTTSPAAGLDIKHATSPLMTRSTNNNAIAMYNEISGGYSHLYLYQINAAARVVISTNGNSYFNGGNVGIGTTSPADGNLQVTKTGMSTGITNVLMNASFADGSNGTGLTIGYRTDETTAVLAPRTATGNLAFYNYDGGWSESMRIKNNGNVGIGTASPDEKLDVAGNIMLSVASSFIKTYSGDLYLSPASNNVTLYPSTGTAAQILNIYNGTSNHAIKLNSSGNSWFNGGNVGIGTTTPNVSGAGSESVVLSVIETSGNRRGILELGDNQNADTGGIGSINFVGTYQDAGHKIMAEIRASGSGATSGQRGSFINFFTKANGTAAIAERMRIDSAGSIKFNAYNGTNNTGSPTHILGTDANGLIVKSTAGSSIGPWLPLAAGSGERVTGDLYISDKLYMRPSSTYGNGYNVMTVTGTNSAPYTSTLSFSNYAQSNVMVIQGSNVGIGTTSPAYQLTVSKNSGFHEAGLDIFQASAGAALQVLRIISDAHGGGGRTGDIAFLTANSATATEKMRILSGGNVGIGTDSPVQPFQVNGQVLFRTTTADGSKNRFQLIPGGSSDAANLYLYYGNTGDGTLSVRINAQGASYFNGGNVGIGTTNPTGKLDVVGSLVTTRVLTTGSLSLIGTDATASAQTVLTISTGVGNATGPNIVLSKSRSQASGAVVASDPLGTIQFQGGNGTASVEGARIQSIAGSTWSSTNRDSDLLFWTTPNASTTIAERMRIDSNGVLQLTSDINGYLNANTIGMEIDINRNPETGTFKDTGLSHARIIMRGDTTANGGSNIKFVTSPTVNTVGTTKMTIAGDGNVGIGTDSPSTQLEIASNTAAGALKITQSAEVTGNAMVYIDNNSASNKPALRIDVTAGGNATDTHGVLINNSGPGYGLIVNGGNVGIGTTSPTQLLHVNSTTANPTGIGLQNSQRYYSVRSNNFSLVFTDETVGSERMRITSAGNVGIGTTSPDSKLDVRGTASGEIARFTTFNGSDSYIYIGRDDSTTEGLTLGYNSSNGDCTIKAVNGSHPIIFEQNTAERMRVASNGGVGINTTNPTEKLEVNGNVKVQGDIIVNSDIELGPSSRIQLDDTPTASTASGSGTIVNWSVSESTTAGTLYTVKSNGGWTTTDADIEAKSTGMLAIALGSNATAGMLLQGFFYKASHGFTIGLPLYISNTAGAFSTTRPTGTNDYVRIIGYATSASYIYFDPDKTWVKLQ